MLHQILLEQFLDCGPRRPSFFSGRLRPNFRRTGSQRKKKDGHSDAVGHPILLSIRVGLYLVGFSLSVASLKTFFICTQDFYVLPTGKNPFSRSPDASIRQHYHRGRKKGGRSEAASHPVLSLLRLERPFSLSHVFLS